MVSIKENKKLNNDTLEMHKYRNDWKYAKDNGLIPDVPYPNWMKPRQNLKFQDEGK